LLAEFSISAVLLRIFAGIVAVAGFPLAVGYLSFRGYLQMFGSPARALFDAYAPHRWLALETIVCVVCIFLFALPKWTIKTVWSLMLLALHFAIWAWLLLKGGQGAQSVYLLLGFPVALIWARYVRDTTLVLPVREFSDLSRA
jgi:hypothetical protein